MNDFVALNEAYDALANSRMKTRQVIGILSLDRNGHVFLKRPKGTIIIRHEEEVRLRGGRSLYFQFEKYGIDIRFEDGAGDLIVANFVPFPSQSMSVKNYTLSLMDDLDGPILDIR
jgi:hypothetical protein